MTFGRRTPKKSTEQRVIEDVILGYDIALEEIGMLEGYFEKHPVSHVGADHPYDEAASHRYLERLEEIRVTITARRAEVALDTADYAQLAIEALALGDELERLNGMTSVVVEEDDFFTAAKPCLREAHTDSRLLGHTCPRARAKEIPMLQIENLHAEIDGKQILNGLTLSVGAGEVHAIMGPNGAGKSTLGYVLGGRPGYEVSAGSVTLDGNDLLEMEPNERAAAGLFLGFQYPVEIPGVSNVQFLRTAINAQRRARGEAELSAGDFLRLAKEQGAALEVSMDMLKRPVNVGFSGGEKKRNEMVQMGLINPRLAVLDETDSGLDIDALRVVGAGINRIMRAPDKAVLLITHYQRLLDIVQPDHVHVLAEGRIVRSGGPELAHELEREGYGAIAA